jgi:hypothetical protein
MIASLGGAKLSILNVFPMLSDDRYPVGKYQVGNANNTNKQVIPTSW